MYWGKPQPVQKEWFLFLPPPPTVPSPLFLWISSSLLFCLYFLSSTFFYLLSQVLSLLGQACLPILLFLPGSFPTSGLRTLRNLRCGGGSRWLQDPLLHIPRTSSWLHQDPRAMCSKWWLGCGGICDWQDPCPPRASSLGEEIGAEQVFRGQVL